jgi:hypothetical protein
MISAGHTARMEHMRTVYKVLVGKPEEKRFLERPSFDGRRILTRNFKECTGFASHVNTGKLL